MIRSQIKSVGMYVPDRKITNNDLQKWMDTSDEWIQQRTGIKSRFWVEGTTNTSDLALKASHEAIQKSGLSPSQIEMIIFATLSPDHDFPGSACFLQAKLGLPGIAALDIRQQCTGFIYGLSIADQFIRAGTYKNILVVGAEVHSKGLDLSTEGRDVAVLFGDGAGAAVVSAVDVSDAKSSRIILSTHLHADGAFARELWMEAPTQSTEGSRITHEMLDKKMQFPTMNGKTVFVHASKRMPECIQEGLEFNKLSLADIDLFVFHQANIRINEMVAKQLGIPESKVFNTIQNYGNTTAATIPIGLCEAEKAGVLKPGMLVASAAFGSGFTWGSVFYRW